MTTPQNGNRSDPYDTEPMSAGTKVGIGAVIALAALLVALGTSGALAPSSTAGAGGPTASSTSTTSVPRAAAVTVDVRAGEYFFKTSVTTFKVGVPYRFVVHNDGGIAHEFMLVEPVAPGMMSMEDMDKMAIGHIELSDLPAHRNASVDVTFTKPYPAGTLEMACHVGQHYENGMHLPIVVHR